jgi:hypothetical protein
MEGFIKANPLGHSRNIITAASTFSFTFQLSIMFSYEISKILGDTAKNLLLNWERKNYRN